MGRIAAAARPATSSDSRRQIRSRCRPLSLRKISTAAPYPTAGQPLPVSRAARNSANASHIGSAVLRIKTVRRPTACHCHLRRPVGTNGCGHCPSSLRYPRKMSFADWLASVAIARSQRMLAREQRNSHRLGDAGAELDDWRGIDRLNRRPGKEVHCCMQRSSGERTCQPSASARLPAGLRRQHPPTFRATFHAPTHRLPTPGALSIPARDDTPRLDGWPSSYWGPRSGGGLAPFRRRPQRLEAYAVGVPLGDLEQRLDQGVRVRVRLQAEVEQCGVLEAARGIAPGRSGRRGPGPASPPRCRCRCRCSAYRTRRPSCPA